MPLVRRSIETPAPTGSSEWIELEEAVIEPFYEVDDMSIDGPSYYERMDLDNSGYAELVEEQNRQDLTSQLPLQHRYQDGVPAETTLHDDRQANNIVPPPYQFNSPPGEKLQVPARKLSPRHRARHHVEPPPPELPSREPSQGCPTATELQCATREELMYATLADLLGVASRHQAQRMGFWCPDPQAPTPGPLRLKARKLSRDLARKKRTREEMLAERERTAREEKVAQQAAQKRTLAAVEGHPTADERVPVAMHQISLSSWLSRTVQAVLVTPLFQLFSRKQNRERRQETVQVFAVPVRNGKRRCILRGDLDAERSPTPHIPGNFDGLPATAAGQPQHASTATDAPTLTSSTTTNPFDEHSAILAGWQRRVEQYARDKSALHRSRFGRILSGTNDHTRGLRTPIRSANRGRRVSQPREVQRLAERALRRGEQRGGRVRPRRYGLARPPLLSRLSERSSEASTPREDSDIDASLANCLAASPITQVAAQRVARSGEDEQRGCSSPTDTTATGSLGAEEEVEGAGDTSLASMAVSECQAPVVAEALPGSSSHDASQAQQQEPAPVEPEKPEASPEPLIRRWRLTPALQKAYDREMEKDKSIEALTRRARSLQLRSKTEAEAIAEIRASNDRLTAKRKADKAALAATIEADHTARARSRLDYVLKKQQLQEEARDRRRAEQAAIEAKEQREYQAWLKEEADKKARAEKEAESKRRARLARESSIVAEAKRAAAEKQAAATVRTGPIFVSGEIIVEPTTAMANLLDEKMRTSTDRATVAKTITGTEIDRIAMARVLGGGSGTAAWLSDATVDAWMLCLCNAMNEIKGWKKSRTAPTPPYVAYSSAWYNQIRDKGAAGLKRWTSRLGIRNGRLDEVEQIFFPICMGSHWTLLVLHGKTHTIEYLDSLGGSGASPIAAVRSLLEAELGDSYKASEWAVARARSQHQTNGDDCGMFTCFNALAAARNVAFREVNAAKMPLARRLMAAILVNGGFTGDAILS